MVSDWSFDIWRFGRELADDGSAMAILIRHLDGCLQGAILLRAGDGDVSGTVHAGIAHTEIRRVRGHLADVGRQVEIEFDSLTPKSGVARFRLRGIRSGVGS